MKPADPKTAIERLQKVRPDATTELRHRNAFELACAVILSAQTTDKLVNTITPELFRAYPTPQKLAAADVADVAKAIARVNFFNNKAKSLVGMAKAVTEKHGGVMPDTMEELTALPGIARKSANVIMITAFGKAEGVVVDTHVTRVSQRLGWTTETDAKKIEKRLMEILPRDLWKDAGHQIVLHGRYTCVARGPKCEECVLNDICPSAFQFPRFAKKATKKKEVGKAQPRARQKR